MPSQTANGNNVITPPAQMQAKRAVEDKVQTHFFWSMAYAAHETVAAMMNPSPTTHWIRDSATQSPLTTT